MPGQSVAQITAMRIAEHAPKSELKGASKEIAESMSKDQIHDFARTDTEGKPEHVKKSEKKASLSYVTGYMAGYMHRKEASAYEQAYMKGYMYKEAQAANDMTAKILDWVKNHRELAAGIGGAAVGGLGALAMGKKKKGALLAGAGAGLLGALMARLSRPGMMQDVRGGNWRYLAGLEDKSVAQKAQQQAQQKAQDAFYAQQGQDALRQKGIADEDAMGEQMKAEQQAQQKADLIKAENMRQANIASEKAKVAAAEENINAAGRAEARKAESSKPLNQLKQNISNVGGQAADLGRMAGAFVTEPVKNTYDVAKNTVNSLTTPDEGQGKVRTTAPADQDMLNKNKALNKIKELGGK